MIHYQVGGMLHRLSYRAESGFRHVETNKLDYNPRLLHFKGDTVSLD